VVGRSSGDIPHCAKISFFLPEMETEMQKWLNQRNSVKPQLRNERKITTMTRCNAKKPQDTKRIFILIS
jgi:hypothetical protein